MKKKILFALVIISIFVSGCFDSKKDKDVKNNTDASGIEAVAVYGDNVVTERNLAGDEEVLMVEGKIINNETLTTVNNLNLKVGDIVLVNQEDQVNVSAKEIASVIDTNNYTVIDAQIEDVFKNLDISKEVMLQENNLNKNTLPRGVNLVENNFSRNMNGVNMTSNGLSYVIEDYVLYESGENEVKVNASVLLKTLR
jgi:hypothetical protein